MYIRLSANFRSWHVGGSTGGENDQRIAKNGVDDKYRRMNGNEIRRPRETGSRSGAMESNDSPCS